MVAIRSLLLAGTFAGLSAAAQVGCTATLHELQCFYLQVLACWCLESSSTHLLPSAQPRICVLARFMWFACRRRNLAAIFCKIRRRHPQATPSWWTRWVQCLRCSMASLWMPLYSHTTAPC